MILIGQKGYTKLRSRTDVKFVKDVVSIFFRLALLGGENDLKSMGKLEI